MLQLSILATMYAMSTEHYTIEINVISYYLLLNSTALKLFS